MVRSPGRTELEWRRWRAGYRDEYAGLGKERGGGELGDRREVRGERLRSTTRTTRYGYL